MRPHRILGAGPSGLAAAIVLARAGEAVEVYEQQADCGARFGGDLQGLESFSSPHDVLDELRAAGLATHFLARPFTSGWQFNGRRADYHDFGGPAFYLVRRGTMPDAIDQVLKHQALELGVTIRFGATLADEAADIVATGPRGRRPYAICKGFVFRTDAPDVAAALLDDAAGFKGYSYLLVSGGEGCLCTSLWSDFRRVGACLAAARQTLFARWPMAIRDERAVGGLVHFSGRPAWRAGASLLVGEAAGLQDFLWAFGLRTALRSGVLAAQALLGQHDYVAAADASFTAHLRGGVVNRFLWELGRFGRYAAPMAALRWRGAGRLMQEFYGFNRVQRMLYPLARGYVRAAHPHLTV
ncbi:MAG: NAD(P)-binding protein [Gemmatimonadaceae bacterium]|nr:NAD(P)-binding protein [Gemmatimonadaceae bacterium]